MRSFLLKKTNSKHLKIHFSYVLLVVIVSIASVSVKESFLVFNWRLFSRTSKSIDLPEIKFVRLNGVQLKHPRPIEGVFTQLKIARPLYTKGLFKVLETDQKEELLIELFPALSSLTPLEIVVDTKKIDALEYVLNRHMEGHP